MDLSAPLPEGDHFADLTKMILDSVAAVETGQFGLLDDALEITIVAVVQDSRKLAARPRLHPTIVRAFNPFKERKIPSSGI